MSEEIVIDDKPAKPAKKAASAKIEAKPAKAAKPKPKPKKEKAAKPKKKKPELTRKRYTIDYTGETYSVKIDKVFEKKIAAFAKQYEFETAIDAMNDLLKTAFGRLAALNKYREKG